MHVPYSTTSHRHIAIQYAEIQYVRYRTPYTVTMCHFAFDLAFTLPWRLGDLGFSREGEMKNSSLGRTARPCAAVDRYQAIDFDEPHRNDRSGTLPPSARANLACPALRMACPPISIPLRQYKLNQRYMRTCQPTHAHTRVHPIIPIPSHLSGFVSLYPDG